MNTFCQAGLAHESSHLLSDQNTAVLAWSDSPLFSSVSHQLRAPLAALCSRGFSVCFSLFSHHNTVDPHYSRACEFAYSLESIWNSKSNTRSTFWVIQGYVSSSKKFASSDVHILAEAEQGCPAFFQLSERKQVAFLWSVQHHFFFFFFGISALHGWF